MAEDVRIEDFITTKKQKAFVHDFFQKSEDYQKWEDVDFERMWESEKTFTVEKEDITFFSEGVLDDNPLFNDEGAAAAGPFGGLIAHPIFLTPIGFWVTGDSGPASWIRTPGAINPGQVIEFFEPIRPGDVIRARSRAHDKYIKRGKRYLTYLVEYFRQDDVMVAKWWTTLILPTSRGEGRHSF
jgi:acyl dehydratase